MTTMMMIRSRSLYIYVGQRYIDESDAPDGWKKYLKKKKNYKKRIKQRGACTSMMIKLYVDSTLLEICP